MTSGYTSSYRGKEGREGTDRDPGGDQSRDRQRHTLSTEDLKEWTEPYEILHLLCRMKTDILQPLQVRKLQLFELLLHAYLFLEKVLLDRATKGSATPPKAQLRHPGHVSGGHPTASGAPVS